MGFANIEKKNNLFWFPPFSLQIKHRSPYQNRREKDTVMGIPSSWRIKQARVQACSEAMDFIWEEQVEMKENMSRNKHNQKKQTNQSISQMNKP